MQQTCQDMSLSNKTGALAKKNGDNQMKLLVSPRKHCGTSMALRMTWMFRLSVWFLVCPKMGYTILYNYYFDSKISLCFFFFKSAVSFSYSMSSWYSASRRRPSRRGETMNSWNPIYLVGDWNMIFVLHWGMIM